MSNSKRSPNEPWPHAASGFWCKKIAGKLHYLDRDEEVAKRKLGKILRERARASTGNRDWLNASFADLCDEFLERKKALKRWSASTYKDYRYRLLRALRVLGTELRVSAITEKHIEAIEIELVGQRLSPTTIRDTLMAMKSVFKWAKITCDPLTDYEMPVANCRNRVVTPEEFQALLRACVSNRPFQRILIALRTTGCRPCELRDLTWDMVDLDQRCWIIPNHKTRKKQKKPHPRIVPMPDCIWKMCRWLKERSERHVPNVFLNCWGLPYTKDRLVKSMERVRKRAGVELRSEEQIVLYSQRHTYATDAHGKVGDIALAEMMGHTDVQMTRRYAHLSIARLHEYQQAIQKNRQRNPQEAVESDRPTQESA